MITNLLKLNTARDYSSAKQTPKETAPQTTRTLQIVNQSYNQKQNKLKGNLRLLQKQYKNNLKEGFENKIKAYRFQSVLDRKIMRNNQLESRRQIQNLNYRHKYLKAIKMKQQQQLRLQELSQMKKKKFQCLHIRNKSQKQHIDESLRQKYKNIHCTNKIKHDQVLKQSMRKNWNQNYNQLLKKYRSKKQQQSIKKYYIVHLAQNLEKLTHLQQQLKNIVNNDIKHQSTLLTIQ